MTCDFITTESGCRCQRCGRTVRGHDGVGLIAECFAAGAPYIIDTLTDGKTLWGCRACHWTHVAHDDQPIEHRCGRPEVVRLGDKIEGALASLGVTQDRWLAAKESLGLPATCNCDARRDWLNRLDEQLGLGEKLNKLTSFLGWT